MADMATDKKDAKAEPKAPKAEEKPKPVKKSTKRNFFSPVTGKIYSADAPADVHKQARRDLKRG
jgi:hypothetical protein